MGGDDGGTGGMMKCWGSWWGGWRVILGMIRGCWGWWGDAGVDDGDNDERRDGGDGRSPWADPGMLGGDLVDDEEILERRVGR